MPHPTEITCIGRYGLVGIGDRRIWLNLEDESLAHEISRVFESKIRLMVYDLSIFKNYYNELLDNTCCMKWTVGISHAVATMNVSFDQTWVSDENDFLREIAQEDLNLTDRKLELQQQMILYRQIKAQVNWPYWLGPYMEKTELGELMVHDLRMIFQTEIHIEAIRNGIESLANKYIDDLPAASLRLLSVVGRVYG